MIKYLTILLLLFVLGCNEPQPTDNLDTSLRAQQEAMSSLNNTITEVLTTSKSCVVNQEEE
jgi:hypothetical protein